MTTAESNSGARLPSSLFSTDQFPQRDQFDAWRTSIGVIFDVSPPARPRRNIALRASIRAYNLGELIVAATSFDAQCYSRDRRRIASDGLDHYLVQLYPRGGLVGSAHKKDLALRAGDLQILDLSQPLMTHNESSATVSIVIPRDSLDDAIGWRANLHGLVLRREAVFGGLMGDYLSSVVRRAEILTTEEAPLVSRSLVEMIAGCFHPTAENLARANSQIAAATVRRIKRFIVANLESPELSVEAICGRFRISRAYLYEIFAPLDGVAKYIQDQRLIRAFRELRASELRHLRIGNIALDLGFSSEAHFSRAFRRAFGQSPHEVRITQDEPASALSSDHFQGTGEGYETWIRKLRHEASTDAANPTASTGRRPG